MCLGIRTCCAKRVSGEHEALRQQRGTLCAVPHQLASRSPSSRIHFGLSSGMLASSRMLKESRPSFHSRVAMLT